jgi:DNA primase
VAGHNLDTAEGRVRALAEATPMVARIKDMSLRDEYARQLAGMVGVDDPNRVVAEARRIAGGRPSAPRRSAQAPAGPGRHDDAATRVEREALKLALQVPVLAGPVFDGIEETAFTDPVYRLVRAAIAAAGGAVRGRTGPAWVGEVADQCPDLLARALVTELAVEPVRSASDPDPRYVTGTLARLQELAIEREVATVKSRLQRINPVERAEEYTVLFGQLIGLEQLRRGLREQALGGV